MSWARGRKNASQVPGSGSPRFSGSSARNRAQANAIRGSLVSMSVLHVLVPAIGLDCADPAWFAKPRPRPVVDQGKNQRDRGQMRHVDISWRNSHAAPTGRILRLWRDQLFRGQPRPLSLPALLLLHLPSHRRRGWLRHQPLRRRPYLEDEGQALPAHRACTGHGTGTYQHQFGRAPLLWPLRHFTVAVFSRMAGAAAPDGFGHRLRASCATEPGAPDAWLQGFLG